MKTAGTQQEVAKHFGVNRRTVAEWLADGCPGKQDNDRFDLDAIAAWRAENREKQPERNLTKEQLEIELLMADVRKRRAEAAIKEHDQLKKTEDVVHISEVELYLTSLFTEGRRKLLKIPETLPMGFPEHLRPAIREECIKQLEIWLRWMANKAATVSEIKEL
ncbi:hypothetical protein LOC67_23445 [Stieleria sp. JC731]|uniref:hypothetical protein n=1 Tax=Pirellulaceae TaxID=2691357 RepID=UPI001E36C308|nr:hypothetical protein [Stieleria sp. JC731]MCC9603515.1 hypothetical protein [Stieleria sp. JC731]